MPSPPITIGELVDVPAPESPINAQFHQEVANRIVHRFANAAAMNAWAAGNGSLAFTTDSQSLYVRRSGTWQLLVLQSSLDATNANLATYPLGMLARAYGTGGQVISLATPPTAVTAAAVTWTAAADRWYRTCAIVPVFRPSAAMIASFWLDPGAQAYVAQTTVYCAAANGDSFAVVEAVESGLTGSQTRTLRAAPQSGGQTLTTFSTYQRPMISVEDMGQV